MTDDFGRSAVDWLTQSQMNVGQFATVNSSGRLRISNQYRPCRVTLKVGRKDAGRKCEIQAPAEIKTRPAVKVRPSAALTVTESPLESMSTICVFGRTSARRARASSSCARTDSSGNT